MGVEGFILANPCIPRFLKGLTHSALMWGKAQTVLKVLKSIWGTGKGLHVIQGTYKTRNTLTFS